MDAWTVQVWQTVVALIDAGETPTTNAIGEVCGMTYSTVAMHLKRLQEAGCITPQSYWHRGVRLKRRPEMVEQ